MKILLLVAFLIIFIFSTSVATVYAQPSEQAQAKYDAGQDANKAFTD